MITDYAKRVRAKAYAQSVRDVVMRKRTLEMEIDHEREELGLTGVALGERVSTSPSMDALPNGVARLIDMVDSYCAELSEYVDTIETFCHCLCQLDPRHQMTLHLRYVHLRDWHEIARMMSYSEKQVFRFHDDGLIALYDVMPTFWRDWGAPDALET